MKEELVRNAADEGQVKEAKHKERGRREDELNDLRFILNSIQGRRFFFRWLSQTRLNKISFVPGDPYYTAFQDGERNGAVRLLAEINEADPKAYGKMIVESEK